MPVALRALTTSYSTQRALIGKPPSSQKTNPARLATFDFSCSALISSKNAPPLVESIDFGLSNEERADALAANSERDKDVLAQKKALIDQLTELDQQIMLAAIPESMHKRELEIFADFERQKKSIRELIDLYPELGDKGGEALNKLDEAAKAAAAALTDTSKELAQALTNAFVNSMDSAFDALFDKTKTFGDKMLGLINGLGESILKAVLHSLITKPLERYIDELLNGVNATTTKGSGPGLIAALGGLGQKLLPSLFGGNKTSANFTDAAGPGTSPADVADQQFLQERTAAAMEAISQSSTEASNALGESAEGLSASGQL
jgi:hypothetical protein